MSNPIDEEVYGHKTTDDPGSVRNGNPGRPQSDFAEPEEPADNGREATDGDDEPAS